MRETSSSRRIGVQGQLAAMLTIGVVIGGGGSPAALPNLIVELFAIAILAFNLPLLYRFWTQEPLILRILVGITLALPLLQLIPMPSAIWTALPGRDLVVRSYDLIGEAGHWRPFSLAPNRTFIAFLALLPPLAVLVLITSLGAAQRSRMLAVMVLLGLANFALGVVQLLSGGRVGNIFGGYGYVIPTHLYGTFASHAATGLFLVLALLALCGVPLLRRGREGFFLHLVIAVPLVLGVVLTQSRSAIALLVVPAAFAAVRTIVTAYRSATGRVNPLLPVFLGLGALGIVGAASLIVNNSRMAASVGRFDNLEDARPGIWEDTASAIDRYWPVGSGTGSFADVFQVDESLENIMPFRAGRAHNDYLELVLELGVTGAVILATWGLWLGWQAVRTQHPDREVHFAAVCGLAAIALQSLLDYPIRNEAILCVAAIFVGLMVGSFDRSGQNGRIESD